MKYKMCKQCGLGGPEKVAIAEADTETHPAVWRHYKVFPKESK